MEELEPRQIRFVVYNIRATDATGKKLEVMKELLITDLLIPQRGVFRIAPTRTLDEQLKQEIREWAGIIPRS